MSKKKHPEHVNHERWLVSYADFITLLFAFFVVLFASGQTDKRKQIKLAEAMQVAFQANGIFDPHTTTPPITDDNGQPEAGKASPVAMPMPTAFDSVNQGRAADEAHRAAKVATELNEVIRKAVASRALAKDAVTLRPSGEGLVVSLREAGFFASGSAELEPYAVEALRTLAAALPHQSMRVEGHTDDLPIHTAQFATNWELSAARAASITRLLLAEHAAAPEQIAAAGLAEFHPIASNATEAGRAQNRRVDIVLLRATGGERPAEAGEATPAPPASASALPSRSSTSR